MHSWLWLVILSGILLGFWDVTKKKTLKNNSVLTVLALYSIVSALLVSYEFSNALQVGSDKLIVIFIKSLIVFVSWLMSFASIKHLPISIITPFNTLNPIFSIIFGIILLGERLTLVQALGILIMLLSYYFLGKVGSMEISGLFKNKYFYYMVGAALLSAISATIDKVALKTINSGQMQFWFSLFLAILNTSSLIFHRLRSSEKEKVVFDPLIILVSILLVVSDRIYFNALNIPGSQISVILPVRKLSVFISVIAGGLIFKEQNLKSKFWCISLLIIGIAFVFLG
jgi:bacterial/archaeal transporter family protein